MNMIKTENFELASNQYGDPDAEKLAILMPGRLDTKDYANFVSHGELLAELGYFAVAIDPPGTWESPGGLAIYSTSSYLQAVNELIDYFGNRPTLLLGHSRGGATAMLASGNPAVERLVVVNSAFGSPTPPPPGEMQDGILVESRDLPPGDSRTEEQILFDLPMYYFEDGKKHNPEQALQAFEGPKLVVHASRDEFVSMDRLHKIFDSLKEPKTLLELDSTHDYRLFPDAITAVNEALKSFIAD